MYEPAIKWSGSKRPMAKEIVSRFPRNIKTYFEPFVGGASVLRRLLDSDIDVGRYVCSDVNADLIAFWNTVMKCPDKLVNSYAELWGRLSETDDIDERKRYFASVRERLNRFHDPSDFLFIMRTCINGMPRYNKAGFFNSSFHVSRIGIEPARLSRILTSWSKVLNEKKVEFVSCDYAEQFAIAEKDDFVYCDPPYFATKGMYFGGFDVPRFFSNVRKLTCRYAISFDGYVVSDSGEKEDLTYAVPKDLYTYCHVIQSGNSSFRRLLGNERHSTVFESLYVREY